jgi:hypothetical protein
MARSRSTSINSSANIGFEAKLWLAADKLRSNMDAAEYKHVVLGLIFLKYISDTFEEHPAPSKPWAKMNSKSSLPSWSPSPQERHHRLDRPRKRPR